jgi:putative ABC transport system permease protein
MDSLITANIKQRPLRTAISIIGVALGVVLVVLFVGLARGTMKDSAERQSNVDAELRFTTKGNAAFAANPLMLPERFADAFLHGKPEERDADTGEVSPAKPPIAGVVAATPVGEWMQSSVGGLGFELVDGIEYDSFSQTTQIRIVDGRPLGDGRKLENRFEAIVDRYYADVNKDVDGRPVQVGSKIKVYERQFDVVGIYEPSMLARVKIPLHTLQWLLSGAEKSSTVAENCTFVMVKCERPEMAADAARAIRELYPSFQVIPTSEIPALYSQGIGAVEVFLNVVIGLAIVISTLVILLGMYTTIIERTREIGILKSLGASKRFIVMSIEKEAALLSTFGVLFGFAISVVSKIIIEANTRLKFDLDWKWLLLAAAIGLLGGIVGALYPAVRAANLDPIEAISYE